jgi:hypothetical protein
MCTFLLTLLVLQLVTPSLGFLIAPAAAKLHHPIGDHDAEFCPTRIPSAMIPLPVCHVVVPTLSTQGHRSKRRRTSLAARKAERPTSSTAVTEKAEARRESFREQCWQAVFQRLVKYKEKFGHVEVPTEYDDGKKPRLGYWVVNQRQAYRTFVMTKGKEGAMTEERIKQLNSTGFVWQGAVKPQHDDLWMANFENLKAFKQKYNSTKVSKLSSGNDDNITKLASWSKEQKKYRRNNRTSVLTPEKIELLDSIDFSWSLDNKTDHEKWLLQYFKLYYHHLQFNNTAVTNSDAYNSKFVNWVAKQKQAYHNGNLDALKIELMNNLNFDWRLDTNISWDDFYAELSEYHKKYSSTRLNKYVNKNLAEWTQEQRMLYQNDSLEAEKINKLDGLNFDWNPDADLAWNAMFDRLLAYVRKYKTVAVPDACSKDPPLGKWAGLQRRRYAKYFKEQSMIDLASMVKAADESATRILPSIVHFSRLSKLNNIGFIWDVNEAQWIEMYKKLIVYVNTTNSTLVPIDSEDDPGLGYWIKKQRQLKNADKLDAHRILLLDELGFIWDPLDVNWNIMFDQFCAYRSKHGGADVSKSLGADPVLIAWVGRQCRWYKENKLYPKRIKMLESIGFGWRSGEREAK